VRSSPEAALDLLEVEELVICPWALREGVILQRLDWLTATEKPDRHGHDAVRNCEQPAYVAGDLDPLGTLREVRNMISSCEMSEVPPRQKCAPPPPKPTCGFGSRRVEVNGRARHPRRGWAEE